MAITFLEPGGDADFQATSTNGFWRALTGAPAVASDFVHGGHQRSIKYRPSNNDVLKSKLGIFSDTGGRISMYVYLVALPNIGTSLLMTVRDSSAASVFGLYVTTAGVLQLQNQSNVQLGSNGPTLSTGRWYRLSIAWTVSSTSVNRFEVFVDAVSAISVTNGTLVNTGTNSFWIGNQNINGQLDFRTSDHYADNSSALADMGDVWVTAKRPVSNGALNQFTTQIGSGGSGYGSGHAPQVNERPLSTTNGWSVIGAGSAADEKYNIETRSQGDIDLTNATVLGYAGWVSASSLTSETGIITFDTDFFNISLTSTPTVFNQVSAGSGYPPAGGKDIGIKSSTTVTTVSLYECGILVAFIPGSAGNVGFFPFM